MKSTALRLVVTGFAAFAALNSARAVVYSVDAGSAVSALGSDTANWSAAGLNHFTVVAGGQNIVSISAVFGYSGGPTGLFAGYPFTVVLWNDPNGDGDPTDATVLGSATGAVAVPFNDNTTFQTTAITPVGLSVGQSFFAGLYVQNAPISTPTGVSLPGSPTQSWVAYNPGGPVNLNNLSSAPAFGTVPALTGQNVALMIRANGVPEPGTAAFAGLAALGLLRRRRS